MELRTGRGACFRQKAKIGDSKLVVKDLKLVWAEVLTGKTVAIMPYIVLVEVVAAVRRRTADKELALKIKKEPLSAGSVNFTIVDPEAALEASDIAIETGMRGMDAIVVQTAKEYGTSLVTLDNEMINKATGIVKIKDTYKCSDFYRPDDEGGINWADPQIAITWPTDKFIISAKDSQYPFLNQISKEMLPLYGHP